VIYLPGGDTSILKREIESRSVQFNLRKHKGIIVGNSAGAIVLSKGGYGDSKFYEGFGIVDIIVSVHSKLEIIDSLEGRTQPIIGIPEGNWISVRQATPDA
jgi:peptidase E